jgi:hypothetical protein
MLRACGNVSAPFHLVLITIAGQIGDDDNDDAFPFFFFFFVPMPWCALQPSALFDIHEQTAVASGRRVE